MLSANIELKYAAKSGLPKNLSGQLGTAQLSFGVAGSWYIYRSIFATFSSRLGARTLLYHLAVILLRLRNPKILEHVLNIIASIALSFIWIGGAVWSQWFDADIWGYKLCVGCQGWGILKFHGGILAGIEATILAMSATLFIRSRVADFSSREPSRDE
ncbi:hypothetical protein AG1IA_03336 [Rhizoctonia solani AG-1 IA]|uniref:Uncharacterized protein n=1 Tax=Thanatephorus cucumeris (strain AG1-IA) TaxID=983506 RepID=L8X0J3_THACA|nr:hypothetical protein AG1IA_03336 [Rhizoctonia solani AG-1 IA]